MSRVTLINVSNSVAWGVEWRDEAGKPYQLVCVRGGTTLLYGAQTGGLWYTAPVVKPERFGFTSPPTSFAGFVAICERFVNGNGHR
jgi:hypothetical protein